LKHKFILTKPKGFQDLAELVEKVKGLVARRGYKLYDDQEDEGKFDENQVLVNLMLYSFSITYSRNLVRNSRLILGR